MEGTLLRKLTPAVQKIWLDLLAGLMWSGVGIFLCSLTIEWLEPVVLSNRLLFVLGGLTLAGLIYYFGFSRLALKNIRRIAAVPKDKVCIFAFQQWPSYPLVAVMIAMGIFLRKYSHLPKPGLAVPYIGIGGSLLLASIHDYRELWQNRGNP